ncbi:MAG TPA: hypothetical protein QF753_06750 [Victivallales bacterium]|nr:hypothetical protein [Victivallales bacterium]
MTKRTIRTQTDYNKYKNKLVRRMDKYVKMKTAYIAELALFELQINQKSESIAIDKLNELHQTIGNRLMDDLVQTKFKNELSLLEKLSKGIIEK